MKKIKNRKEISETKQTIFKQIYIYTYDKNKYIHHYIIILKINIQVEKCERRLAYSRTVQFYAIVIKQISTEQ